MSEQETDKGSLKFWIASLAFCVLVMATTFAFLAMYLANVKSSAAEALAMAQLTSQRMSAIDAEMIVVHKHLLAAAPVAQPASAPVAAEPAAAPTAAPAAAEPAATAPALPVIQSPTLVAPSTKP